MPLVPAKCTSCGAQLTVDNTKDAAICEFCNTPYIVEKAINNYTISGDNNISISNATVNVQGGPSIDSMLTRAAEFEQMGDIDRALEYYNRILDIDSSKTVARNAIYRIENTVLEQIPFTWFFASGTLTLTRTKLIYSTQKKRMEYSTKAITSVSRNGTRLTIGLSSQVKPLEVTVGYTKPAKCMEKAITILLMQRYNR
ncbi:MAG: hypothetical protein IJC98_03880 [Clostridia bacterium]|nr:hypothetical protein [Clostridia bacterium]